MPAKTHSLTALCLLALIISGCSSITLPGFVRSELIFDKRCADKQFSDKNGKQHTITDSEGEISTGYIKALLSGHAKIDAFLDCALAEAPKHETRLYRGHVLLSLLASYGAYNLSVGQYEESIGDAITLLTHIREAEKSLRAASREVKPDENTLPYQESPLRLKRISNLLEVALYAERPTLRRGKKDVRSLLGGIAADATPSILQAGVEGAMRGISKSIHLRLYGKAYLKDARDDLARFADGSVLPETEDWKNRSVMIQDACDRIRLFAQLDAFDCIVDTESGL
ncbi:MAG: hypothetical protein KME56_04355 [Candidatus Thiodiazotropha sp. (ex Ctena orbiculata)]|nr:hypothetical protein [Candidatus Thiodiazotropha taylori]MBT2995848.1 hypothetical protein [Candidatus Thiodiazotropha taylori]MBT2999163.1 hypothetical protein [Candidatus Thiodiazotropha taylori]MBV2105664.1 hypothetical protein [Candidatus Thiodiazotropha taylori]MBV2112257.1 hypothetical protein [Candidatus Thiodiazotropha taylori]